MTRLLAVKGRRLSAPRLSGVRLLCALLLGLGVATAGGNQDAEEGPSGPPIHNPYFETAEWKVWRDDDAPVEGVTSVVREGKEDKAVEVTLEAPPVRERLYPVDPPKAGRDDPYVVFEKLARPSRTYAGIWDDVYSSWSGTHGYIRTRWMGLDGSSVTVRGHMIDFVDARKNCMLRAGVNFIHQSTTGMAHAITNGTSVERTGEFEKLYFADLLVTAPAHASLTDHRADYSTDLFTAHVPTLFNSVGSSNSETMAITKMIIAGGYLPPKTKLLLKRNGLYPAAMLYLWRSALPYDVPYDHELRQRIAYKAVGNRDTFPENYSAAGIDRGDMSLVYHRYDDEAHMRAMIEGARSMDVALPEALFEVTEVKGGQATYLLRKSALIVQEPDQTVELTVSTAGCYDLQELPLTTRWKLLYGNKRTRIEPVVAVEGESAAGGTTWTITIPWDEALPGGRTAIALTANNGRFDSNPAILTIFRKKGDLPPGGMSPGEYTFPPGSINNRPVILGLQDRVVKRGKTLELPLIAVDPEGFSVAFYKRSGQVGTIDGSQFTWDCPRKEPRGPRTVSIIASDGTSGNSYGGEQLTIHVDKPDLLAQITVDHLMGPAPLEVRVSAKESVGPRSRMEYGWDFYTPAHKRKAKLFTSLVEGREAKHTFDKPGLYEISLTVLNGEESDTETIRVFVTQEETGASKPELQVEGNGVYVLAGDETPSTFDHTDFGMVALRDERVHTFRVANVGGGTLPVSGRKSFTLTGEHAGEFKVVRTPHSRIESGGSASFDLRFAPKEVGLRQALLKIHAGSKNFTFAIQGQGSKR